MTINFNRAFVCSLFIQPIISRHIQSNALPFFFISPCNKPAQSLLKEKSRALGEWIALDLDQAGGIKALKEEEAYDELLEERRYLRRQVELINQWNEQGVLNERLAAERKEDEFERGVNRQRESWREQEFLMSYEATYLAFRESAARFERWMAEGGLEELGEKLSAQGASELEVSALKNTAVITQDLSNGMKDLNKDVISYLKGKAESENTQKLVGALDKTTKDLSLIQEKYQSDNPQIEDIRYIFGGVCSVASNVVDAQKFAEAVIQDPNSSPVEKNAAWAAKKHLESSKFQELLSRLNAISLELGYDKPFTEMSKEEQNDFRRRIEQEPEANKACVKHFGKNVKFDDILTQANMAQNYDSYQKNTALLLQSAIENYNKHIKSAAPEVGPISAFTELQISLKNAVFSATKEVAVETTDLALKGKTHNYSVIKMTNPDTKENIQIFVEKNGEDYDLGNFGRLMGEKINDLIDRKNYPNLSDSDYRRLAEETLYNFVSTGMGGQLTINENGHDQHVNSINIALSKMAAINVLIQKNGTLPDGDTIFDNLRGSLSQALKEKALKGHGVDYAKEPALLEEAIEKAIREVEKGTFNTKDFYDMSAELQKQYTNQNEKVDAQTSELAKQANDDNKAIEEANNYLPS